MSARLAPRAASRRCAAPFGARAAAARTRAAPLVCRASPLDKIRAALMGGAQVADEENHEEMGEMAPLEGSRTPAGTEDVFGPTAVLLVGFMRPEVDQVQALLSDMGADMVAVIPATPAMMEGSLQQALEGGPVPYEQPKLAQRRAVVLSGMYTSEVLEIIGAYKDAGLPPTVFAAAVPRNYERPVGEVVDSCWKDQQAAQQRAALGKLEASIEEDA